MPTANVSVSFSPTLVFTPSAVATSATFTNTGSSVLYLGQSGVTAALGFPIQPGDAIEVGPIFVPIYAVAGVDTLKTPTATASGSIAQGATAITVASGGTSFTNGMVISIQDGNNSELVVVGSGSTGTSVVVAATAKAHPSGVTFGQFANHNGGSLKVTYGTGI